MTKPRQDGSGSFFRHFLDRVLQKRRDRRREFLAVAQRRLRFEPLEGRALLATDLATITGIVSQNTPVQGASIELFEDTNNNDVFDPGASPGDTQVGLAVTTDASGRYTFDRLEAGDYFVRQPAQTAGAVDLGEFVSPLITITTAEAAGIAGTSIDDFNNATAQMVQATGVTPTASDATDYDPALGDERDLFVSITNPEAIDIASLNSQSGQLQFSTSAGAQASFVATYDGDDNDANTLSFTSMAGQDLTDGAGANISNVFVARAQADQAGAQVSLRVYSDSVSFSDVDAQLIPPGVDETDLVFEFDDFEMASGASAPANFASVVALEFIIVTTTDGTDGHIDFLGAFAPTIKTQNITNEADLRIDKTVDDDTPIEDQTVTFTLRLINDGPAGATDIQVTDVIPPGMAFVNASGDGSYSNQTSIWDVGDVAGGATATIEIRAAVTAPGQKTNTAQITAADQPDPDANNNTDQVTLNVPPSADLDLEMTIDDNTPNVSQTVTFTLVVTNDGPDAAAGVTVTDQLPSGLTFISANPAVDYNNTTGIWTVGDLANGASETLTIQARLTTSAPVTNVAEVTASSVEDIDSAPGNGLAEDDRDSITIDAPPAADLGLDMTINDTTPDVGQTVTFTLVVTNDGPDDATGVTVTDQLPSGLAFVSANPAADYNNTTGAWSVGDLANGASETLTIQARVTSSAEITNSAQVTASGTFDPNSTPNDGTGDDFDSVTIDAPPAADLSLDLEASSTTPNLSTTVTFTLRLTNSGPDTATGVIVTDDLPDGLTFVSADPPADYNSTTGVWNVGDIASGVTDTLTIVARVENTAPITNTAQVTTSPVFDPDSVPNDGAGDDFDSVQIDAPPAADLSLDLQASSTTPNLSTTVTFTLRLTNSGPDTATGVIVTDDLPDGLTFVSANPAADYNSTTGAWNVGDIASGTTDTLTIVARVENTAPITNTAQVTTSPVFDPDSTPNDGAGDDFDSVQIDAPPAADLSLDLQASSTTPNLSTTVTFTLRLTNSGPDTATGVIVTDQLPAGLTFVSANPAADYNSTTGVWNVGDIASSTTDTLTIVARVENTAPITNSAQVTTSPVFDPDSTPNDGTGDDFDSVQIDAPAAADLSLDLQASSTTPNLSATVTFTLTLTNSGPDAATGVNVTDQLPAGLTFVSANPAADYNSTTGVWTVGDIASGATDTLTIVARVNNTAPITNSAQVSASGVFDPDSTPNDGAGDDFDSVQLDASAAADLSLTLTVDNPTQSLGQNVVLTVTVSNAGPDQATNVAATCALPPGLTFVSSTPSQGSFNSTTGVWTIGSINSGANATLQITATVAGVGPKTTTARVTASDQFDPDSTPGNTANEDDQASVTVTPPQRFSKRLFLAR